ncbi:extracellular solute-binding protein [Virgisporangium ochraceum]|jgi:multiple sugar transport system substrate-binding protein|nr:extracellular solute-binding protein [Virgisporangium ochraceum]
MSHPRPRQKLALFVAALVAAPTLVACGSDDGANVLTFWQSPDSSGVVGKIVDQCNQQANGRYVIRRETLPNSADAQREQLVRRLAAKDKTMNVLFMDVIWAPEFAEAKWILPFEGEDEAKATDDILQGPKESATWKGKLYAAPFSSNSQLLWYRKSLAKQAGIDPTAENFTWDDLIDASSKMPENSRFVEIQANRYEGYMVWINGLISSAGGSILENTDAGTNAKPGVNSDAGRRAAEIIQKFVDSPAADFGLSTAIEETTRAAFQNGNAWAMLNWPYIYGLGSENAGKDANFKPIFEDYGWARYPRVDANTPSAPPIGGAMIGVGAYTPEPKRKLAFEAAACITSPESQKQRMDTLGEPATRASIYDDPGILAKYPFAPLIRDSIDQAAPRPLTPFYNDVTIAIQRTWHPPGSVNPNKTPKESNDLISKALKGKVLI